MRLAWACATLWNRSLSTPCSSVASIWLGSKSQLNVKLLQRPCGSWPASECSAAVMPIHRHESPAGWLLQRQAAAPLWELACQRMLACGDAHSQARFASRLAPTKTSWLFPCRSWPASECSPAVMPVHRHDSPAGWLLQRQAAASLWELACQRMLACGDAHSQARFASRLAPTKTSWLFPCRSWPASECSPAVMPIHRHDSPAGWLLQNALREWLALTGAGRRLSPGE